MAQSQSGFNAYFSGIATRKDFDESILETIKDIELSNNDVSVFIPNIIKDLKGKDSKNVNTIIGRIIIKHHPEKIDEVVEVLESLIQDSGWRSIRVFGDGSTLGDIDDEVNFVQFALKPKVRDLAFERLVENGNPMTLVKILEYAKENKQMPKIKQFYSDAIPDNYSNIVKEIEGEIDTVFVKLLQTLDSGEVVKYKPTSQARRTLARLNENRFTELYKILETIDRDNPLKRFMKDSISQPAKIKILRDLLTQLEDKTKVRGQLANVSAGTKTAPSRTIQGEKASWKRLYGELTPRQFVVSNMLGVDIPEEQKEREIDRQVNLITGQGNNSLKDAYNEIKTQSVDITYGDIRRNKGFRTFLSELISYDSRFFGSDNPKNISRAKTPLYPLLTILLLNPPIKTPNDYQFIDSSIGPIGMGKAVLENMLFIFDKFNINIKGEFKEKFERYCINGNVKKLDELKNSNVNFQEVENELNEFVDEKASTIVEVILNNILELLGNINSKLTYYKPSPKAFREAGRTRQIAEGEIDTDTAIEYLEYIGLIEERT
tara:strand:+ start:22109 stop:23749 length:1641 start_codon:yes stop_codon:yes gene_type:complete